MSSSPTFWIVQEQGCWSLRRRGPRETSGWALGPSLHSFEGELPSLSKADLRRIVGTRAPVGIALSEPAARIRAVAPLPGGTEGEGEAALAERLHLEPEAFFTGVRGKIGTSAPWVDQDLWHAVGYDMVAVAAVATGLEAQGVRATHAGACFTGQSSIQFVSRGLLPLQPESSLRRTGPAATAIVALALAVLLPTAVAWIQVATARHEYRLFGLSGESSAELSLYREAMAARLAIIRRSTSPTIVIERIVAVLPDSVIVTELAIDSERLTATFVAPPSRDVLSALARAPWLSEVRLLGTSVTGVEGETVLSSLSVGATMVRVEPRSRDAQDREATP